MSEKFVNTTLFVYSDAVENYEVVGRDSAISTTNPTALEFCARFFADSTNQRLLLKSATSSYEGAIESVPDQFLYCCTDAKETTLERLLAYCVGKPFILAFYLPTTAKFFVPKADNLIAVVTGFTEVNFLSNLYPIVTNIGVGSGFNEALDLTTKTLLGFSTEEMTTAVAAEDVVLAFFAPNSLALNEIVLIANQQIIWLAELEAKFAELSSLLSLLQQLEQALAAAPEGEKEVIQAQIDLLRVDIGVLLFDALNLINQIEQANQSIETLLLLILSTLPDDVPITISDLLADVQDLLDSLIFVTSAIKGSVEDAQVELANNTPAADLIAIVIGVPPQVDQAQSDNQNIIVVVGEILDLVQIDTTNQIEGLSSGISVLDVVQQRLLASTTMQEELLQSVVVVQDIVRDQILLSNTMQEELLQSTITVQDIVRT